MKEDGGGLVKKPTRYLTNSNQIAKELSKRCSNSLADTAAVQGAGSGGPHWTQIWRSDAQCEHRRSS